MDEVVSEAGVYSSQHHISIIPHPLPIPPLHSTSVLPAPAHPAPVGENFSSQQGPAVSRIPGIRLYLMHIVIPFEPISSDCSPALSEKLRVSDIELACADRLGRERTDVTRFLAGLEQVVVLDERAPVDHLSLLPGDVVHVESVPPNASKAGASGRKSDGYLAFSWLCSRG